MSEEQSAARHVFRFQEIDGEAATIRFSPDVLRSLAALDAAIGSSKRFDGDLRTNLKEIAAGKEVTVRAAISNIGHIAQEALDFVRSTGNAKAREALDDLFDALACTSVSPKPVTVVVPKIRGRVNS